MVFRPKEGLEYLNYRPVKIHWKVVAGQELNPCQKYDLVFDEVDLRIRQINNEDNLIYLKSAQTH